MLEHMGARSCPDQVLSEKQLCLFPEGADKSRAAAHAAQSAARVPTQLAEGREAESWATRPASSASTGTRPDSAPVEKLALMTNDQ